MTTTHHQSFEKFRTARRCLLSAALLAVPLAFAQAEGASPTSVTIDGVTYGAQADERGPIGGGAGYREIVTTGDYTVRELDGLINALAEATSGETVFIPGDAEIDLTSLIYIDQLVLEVPAGVTLASDRGRGDSQGALLTSDALKTPQMIRAAGAGVRVTGLRLRGPNTKRYLDHHHRAFDEGGGRRYYYRFPTSDGIVTLHAELTVDNCEISGFAHAGIFLRGGDGHQVHHNSIHHCQYQGLGYGVCHDAATSTIEQNLFDWNRHSVAGTGRPGTGYVARNNVELGTSLSHCFDMHGGRDRGDGTNIAGTRIVIENNTFGAGRLPIKIRGVPQESCTVTHNWFPLHPAPDEAVVAEKRTTVADNAYGPEPVSTQ